MFLHQDMIHYSMVPGQCSWNETYWGQNTKISNVSFEARLLPIGNELIFQNPSSWFIDYFALADCLLYACSKSAAENMACHPGGCCWGHFICTLSLYLHTTKLLGGILFSLRPSVRPSRIPCLLCSTYSWIFGNFLKFVTLTLSFFDLGSDVNHWYG